MTGLTDRQRKIFQFVETFIAECGYPPTRKDICEAFGFTSPNAAEQHLQAIAAKGHIRLVHGSRGRGISRGIVLLAQSATVLLPPPQAAGKRPARK